MTITPQDLACPNLHPIVYAHLLSAVAAVDSGLADVSVCLTYKKQTDTPPRIAGEDYPAMPGVAQDTQMGRLTVHRHVDNAENRRLQRVGRVYLRVKTVTRANGVDPYGFTNIRPEGITNFTVTGFQPRPPQTAAQGQRSQKEVR